jgi:signal transduction histidine kinase
VLKIKEESVHLAGFLNADELPTHEDRAACHRSMDQVLLSIDQVEGMVRALLRRAGQGEAGTPEWVHLHELLMEEMDLMKAEGLLPEDLPVELNFMAPRDLLLGVHSDFSEVFSHLFRHALGGGPGQLTLRSWGGASHFRLELEDDGAPIDPGLLATAFEPFPDLRPAVTDQGRRPGPGLPACAQLMNAYGGTVEILPAERGSLIRISLPMD